MTLSSKANSYNLEDSSMIINTFYVRLLGVSRYKCRWMRMSKLIQWIGQGMRAFIKVRDGFNCEQNKRKLIEKVWICEIEIDKCVG